jgi:aspartate dehydrogenase
LKLGLIGYGAVALQALDALAAAVVRPLDALVVLVRPGRSSSAQEALRRLQGRLAHDVIVVETIERLIAYGPRIVAEAAGQEAVRASGPALLAAGVDFLVVSAGALADRSVRDALDNASAAGGGRWECCAGAVGGLDILAAARLAGLEEVIYTSCKPPQAWTGTPAEHIVDLASMSEATCFFEGDAASASRAYPQNANVAATIALAGAGFERTRVRLVADPASTRNVHVIRIRSACVDVTIDIAGHPAPGNPKTSLTTGYAMAANLLARLSKPIHDFKQ